MRSAALAVIAATVSALAGCGDDGGGPPPSCLPDCAGDRSYDAIAYTLHAAFDWDAGELTAHEDLTVAPGASPVVELDAGVTVTAVHAEAAALAYVADPEGATLRVDLTPIADGAAPVTFTVDYTAAASSTLRVGGPRDDDPVTSRFVFTDSEPDRGHLWLVEKDDPADRAVWSAELAVAPDQDVVANGERIADATADGLRTVRYALDTPIPTYLMAFAAGDLDHTERSGGSVPLAVWYRRGLPVDPDATLDVVADAMATFEAKLGPYPFSRYSVILAPGYGGGMENATITVNAETSGLGRPSFGLNAHELAHHWFGDWVTMRTYDDVWVKEGMATLLAAEADRARRDRTGGAPRLFGSDFGFFADDAIVDPELHGLDKYGTGPYERAAWLVTQIRHEVGETAFWAALRQVLTDHAAGTITGPEFLAAFPLDPAAAATALASLTVHGVPTVTATTTPVAAGTRVQISLTDPDGTVIAPLGVTAIDGAGVATVAALAAGAPVDVTVPADGYLALDEADVHPDWTVFDLADDGAVLGYTAPIVDLGASAAALAAFAARSAAAEERGLDLVGLPVSAPAAVTALYGDLDSTLARRSLVVDACSLVHAGGAPTGLTDALVPILDDLEVATYATILGWCGPTVGAAFAGELAALAGAPTPTTAGRLEYLMSFDYGAAAALATFGPLAETAPTLRLRERALSRLVSQAAGRSFPAPAGPDRDGYLALFRGKLAAAASETRVNLTWQGAYALRDLAALPALADRLRAVALSAGTQLTLVCQAADLAQAAPAAWTAFQTATMPWDTLDAAAAAALADPSVCFAGRAAPARRAHRAAGGGERVGDLRGD